MNPVGLFDLERNIRPVGRAYKELIEQWRELLPAQSFCLIVPITLPREYDDIAVTRRREWMRQFMARHANPRYSSSTLKR